MCLIIGLVILLLLILFLYGACVSARKADQEIEEMVEENFKADEKENFEAEATLVAMRTFLSINGCSKE